MPSPRAVATGRRGVSDGNGNDGNARATLEEAMDSLTEAGQRVRSVQNRMRVDGMDDAADYRDLFVRITTALASMEAAYLEARRRRQLLDRDAGS